MRVPMEVRRGFRRIWFKSGNGCPNGGQTWNRSLIQLGSSREADRLIRGVWVSFDTTNTRDSIYRASVDFILTICGRAPSYSSLILIDGEDVRQFIAGLAVNIGLESTCAARIVSAALAACTRSSFLQAWALEFQGKHAEAKLELSKPETEMVARSLEKHLKIEQREFLMNLLIVVCGGESKTTLAEALGLIAFASASGEQV